MMAIRLTQLGVHEICRRPLAEVLRLNKADFLKELSELYRSNWIERRLRSKFRGADLEDLKNETIVKSLNISPDVLANLRSLRNYLTTVITNLVFDVHRTQERRERLKVKFDGSLASDDFNGELADPTPSPYRVVLCQQLWEEVARAIGALCPRQREAFELRFICHLPYTEIAYRMGIAESTAATHVSKAIEKLLDILEATGASPTDLRESFDD